MKEFKAPKLEVVYFNQNDVIATSDCRCVTCTICPPNKNDCACYDFTGSYTNE